MSGTVAPSELADLLAQSAFTTMGTLTRLAADHDLSLTQLRVLAILRDRVLRMSDLVEHLGLEKSTLTGLVNRAEARGLLRRAPTATDRRAVQVLLTDAGRHLAETMARELDAHFATSIGRLSASERTRLHELLATLLG